MKISINTSVVVIGLGYVGLPLAVEIGKRYPTIGFDINQRRVDELRNGCDKTLEVDTDELRSASRLAFTTDLECIRNADVYIVTVPTPVDEYKKPDMAPLKMASEIVGKAMKRGSIVVFESTVYPGATEEYCVPVMARVSGLEFNKDFFAGYSPERINPGDKEHRLTSIVKVTSGSTEETADFVDALYASVIPAGTHRASSIKIAEAAKVIENTQRDLNIALMNELAIIFRKIGIDTEEVLNAAGTKWNFLRFNPGLVGGHCIGVDPYYLTHKAEGLGYHPQVILAGRRINDNMSGYVVGQLVKQMIKRGIRVENANVLVMGMTFKENCPDLRNSKVLDSIAKLRDYNINVDVYDPWVSADVAQRECGLVPVSELENGKYDAIVVAVAHRQFKEWSVEKIRSYGKEKHVLFDLKYVLPKQESDLRL
jgi:UDP-N-acetyl-D-galactosamine dehydrogenase